jgi:N-acyl-L-homoserine lactone synthetase
VSDKLTNGFREHDYRITWRPTAAELCQIGELRAEVFCRELGWTGSADDRTERDEFDDAATQLAVIHGSEVIGTVRLSKARAPWMLDTVFCALAPAGRIAKDPDTAEASRLAVSRKWRGKRLANGMRTCDLLYKAAYVYCRINGIRHLYIVVSDIVLNHMQRSGLPCRQIGAMRQMPDGVRATTVVIDWHRIGEDPALAAWFQTGWQMPPPPPTSVEQILPYLAVANSEQQLAIEVSA